MFTVENHVGRLLEIRMASPITLEELGGFQGAILRVVSQTPGTTAVGCTDLLGARVFDQAVTNRLVSIIRHENPRVERNALLVGEGAVFSMQTERIIREAGSASRRAFRSTTDLTAWLGEVLTASERARLSTFLREGARLRRDPEHI
jgi:hypothetical protein